MVITCSGGVGFCNILHPLKRRQDLFTGFFGFALADIVFHIHIGKTFMAVNRMIRLPDLSANRSEAGIVLASCLEFIVFFRAKIQAFIIKRLIHNNLTLFRINSHKVLHNQYFSLIFIFLIKPARRVPLAPPFFLRERQWHQ